MILGFAGKISSGKSTVSLYTADKLKWKYTSFGNLVKTVAISRGISPTRENLQNLGQGLVENDVDNFCKSVLAQARWNKGEGLVIDGIRHTKVLTTLKYLVAPNSFKLIFLKVSESVRQDRLATRDLSSQIVDRHVNEHQVLNDEIENLSDVIVDADQGVERQFQTIIEKLRIVVP